MSTVVVYRYGFNGKENDNEVKGEGNQQDYGMRVYDPRIGKFLSVDPLTRSYPMLTPYQYASNSPIAHIDLDGLEKYHYAFALNNQGEPQIELSRTEHFSEWQWNPKRGGTALGFQLYEKVQDPRKEYTVEYSYDDMLVVGFAASHVTSTLTASFKSEQEALNATWEDFGTSEKKGQVAKGMLAGLNMPGIPTRRARLTPGASVESEASSVHSGRPARTGFNYENFGSEGLDIPSMRDTKMAGGAYRARTFGATWEGGSLSNTVNTLVPGALKTIEMGKTIFSNGGRYRVIYDDGGNYFRIEDMQQTGKRRFTDLQGTIPGNKIVNGKQKGRTPGEYQNVTHFNNTDKSH